MPANSQERQQQQLREEQTRDSFVWAFIEVQCRSLRTPFRLYVPDARCPRGIRIPVPEGAASFAVKSFHLPF